MGTVLQWYVIAVVLWGQKGRSNGRIMLAYESIVVESINCHVHVGFPFGTYACKTEVRVMPAAGGLRADSLRGHRRHIQLFFLLDVRFHSHWPHL
jgi:hypothetical protein